MVRGSVSEECVGCPVATPPGWAITPASHSRRQEDYLTLRWRLLHASLLVTLSGN